VTGKYEDMTNPVERRLEGGVTYVDLCAVALMNNSLLTGRLFWCYINFLNTLATN
jgi:hypothetical protein